MKREKANIWVASTLAAALLLAGCHTVNGSVAPGSDAQVLEVEVAQLGIGEAVCIGSLEILDGTIWWDVQAEAGSGLFLGLHTRPDLTQRRNDTVWDQYIDGMTLPFIGDERSVRVSEGLERDGTYYVYVGCVESDDGGTGLTDIHGTVTYR